MQKILQLVILTIFPFIFSYADDIIELELHIKDHKFEPSMLTVPAGKKIRLTVFNDDSTIEEFDSIDLKREKIIPGKSFARIILAPLKAGKYCFIGEFHADTAEGCLIVE